MMPPELRIDPVRLLDHLREIGRIGADPTGGYTRLSYTLPHQDATRLAGRHLEQAGFVVAQDPVGNLVGVLPGSDPTLRPIAIGSHLDTVPCGGAFDGVLGVVAGLEVGATLAHASHQLRHPLIVLAFVEEEGATFGIGCLGSRCFTGELGSDVYPTIADHRGRSLRDYLAAAPPLFPPYTGARRMSTYLELHIEQGPVLERRGVPVGIVESIVGIARMGVSFIGEPNHAGTTAMIDRKDALWGASELVLRVRELGFRHPERLRATVGRIRALPGASNVVPGEAQLTVELRSPTSADLGEAQQSLTDTASRIATEFHLDVTFTPWDVLEPVLMDATVRETIAHAAKRAGPSIALPSWAGHDAKVMAATGPTGMVFIPSAGGISHSPAERSTDADLRVGAQVLLDTVLQLDAHSFGDVPLGSGGLR